MELPRLEVKYRSYNKVIEAMEKAINQNPAYSSGHVDPETSRLEQDMRVVLRDHNSAAVRVVAILRYGFRLEQIGLRQFDGR